MCAPERSPKMTNVSVRYIVDDVAASIEFYVTHLGFALEQDARPAFASVTRGSLRLLLSGQGSSGARPMPDCRRPVPGGWNRILLTVSDRGGSKSVANKRAELSKRNTE